MPFPGKHRSAVFFLVLLPFLLVWTTGHRHGYNSADPDKDEPQKEDPNCPVPPPTGTRSEGSLACRGEEDEDHYWDDKEESTDDAASSVGIDDGNQQGEGNNDDDDDNGDDDDDDCRRTRRTARGRLLDGSCQARPPSPESMPHPPSPPDHRPPPHPEGEPPQGDQPSLFGVCKLYNCHSFRLRLYVRTRPQYQSLGSYLKVGMVLYLNAMQDTYNYRVVKPNQPQGSRHLVLASLESVFGSLVQELLDSVHPDAIADLLLVMMDPEVLDDKSDDDWWWWKFQIQFNCYNATTHSPITDKNQLVQFRQDTRQVIADGIESHDWRKDLMDELNFPEEVIFQLEKPGHNDSAMHPPTNGPSSSGDTPEPIIVSDPFPDEGLEPLDSSEWDWRRSLGLGMLVTTITATIFLTQVAGFRRRKREKKELWGNLATEEGVSELLRMGWKVNGNKLEIFDKKNVGYKDDDSVLVGGYEQRENVVGTEISVTNPTSEATPETR